MRTWLLSVSQLVKKSFEINGWFFSNCETRQVCRFSEKMAKFHKKSWPFIETKEMTAKLSGHFFGEARAVWGRKPEQNFNVVPDIKTLFSGSAIDFRVDDPVITHDSNRIHTAT